MSVENEIHVGDVGTIFRVTITDENGAAVDVSGATVKKLYFRNPNGTLLEKTAAFTTTGVDGKLQYTAIAGDLSRQGAWSWQAYVKLASWEGYSDMMYFRVFENLTQ